MAIKYNIKDESGRLYDISYIPEFKQFLISQEDIEQHMVAQLEYYKGLKEKKLSPVIISVTEERFNSLVREISLCFPDDDFVILSEIPIYLGFSNVVSILIINLNSLNND